jgi:anti-sigma B factor antagonist
LIIRLDGGVVIIDLRVNPANERELLDVVHGLLSEGHRQFVVNLSQLKWLDSAGLGGVAGAYTTVMRHGGGLVLANAPPTIKTLLEHTKLSTIVAVHDSEQEAIESLNAL